MRPNKYIRNREYLKRLEKKHNSLRGSKYLISYITKEPDPRYIRDYTLHRLPAVFTNTMDRLERYVNDMCQPFDDINYYYYRRPEVEYGIKKIYNSSNYSRRKHYLVKAGTKYIRQGKCPEDLPLNRSLYKKIHRYRYF